MKMVTFQFPSLHQLWKFKLAIEANACEIKSDNTITCLCNDDNTELAIKQYKGKLLQKPAALPPTGLSLFCNPPETDTNVK